MGINVYVVYGIAQKVDPSISLEEIFKGILPFMLAIMLGIGLLFLFPKIVLFLPNLMY